MALDIYNPESVIFALDIGTRTIVGTVGFMKNKKFVVIAESYLEHDERAMYDGQIHDVNLVSEGVLRIKNDLESKINLKLRRASIAAAGRFLRTITVQGELKVDSSVEIDKTLIRSLELSVMRKAEQEINVHTDGKLYCVGYSVKNYFLNGYIISNLIGHKGEKISAEIIATFLPRSVVDGLYSVMNRADLVVEGMTLEPIAAIEAAIPQKLRLLNLALVDIGAGTSDIALSNSGSINAYGMVPLAGDEVTECVAQNLLVDFNTAERVKRECSLNGESSYVDIIGIENTISLSQLRNFTDSVVKKISTEISTKILELNGGKSPSAVFLVGGGAHTPGLLDNLASELNLPAQRISIRGRETVEECICIENTLGSSGITVLGIALVAVKNSGHDFIDVTLNHKVISLFNSHQHTILDVLLQAGVNSNCIMGKSGKNIKFTLNEIRRIAFGTLAKNAEITINESLGSIDSVVKEGDIITVRYAEDGKDACPKVMDYVKSLDSTSFYLDGVLTYIEPMTIINGIIVSIDSEIKDGDIVQLVNPNTVGEFIKFNNKHNTEELYKDGKLLPVDYKINEGDILTSFGEFQYIHEVTEDSQIKKVKEDPSTAMGDSSNDITTHSEIDVKINGNLVKLKNREQYIFIDVFNFIDFDLSRVQGKLVLLLNGNKAGFQDILNPGDDIKIFWE